MKENIKNLLVDAYLTYISGAYDIVDDIINYGELIYCELNDKDIEEFRKEIKEIYNLVWDKPPCYYSCDDEYKAKKQLYYKLLNKLL